ncbi:MAG: zinc-dependent peptidase [Bacteroidales bacterium]|nr:zinc-dependent peptidase [Bacteroidales bacterium]
MGNIYALLFLVFVVAVFIYVGKRFNKKNTWEKPIKPFPASWRKILFENVAFYNNLDVEEKKRFEFKVHEFLINCNITGVETEVNEYDRVLN